MNIGQMKTAFLRFWEATKSRARTIFIIGAGIVVILAAVFVDPFRSFVQIIPNLLTWPIALLLIVIYLGSSSTATTRISHLIGRFGSVKLLGSEVTFTSEGARQLLRDAEEAFEGFRRQAEQEIKRQVRAQNLYGTMSRVFTQVNLSDLSKKNNFRCTVHIEDILFKDTLYQLLEYYPRRDGPAGRRFSVRFGMIGLAWRMERHEGQGTAAAETQDELVRNWGMKQDEASDQSRQRPSYLCVILRTDKGAPIGILFMDSGEENAFGKNQQEFQELADEIAQKCKEIGFQEGLETVVSELRTYSAGIEIHG